MKKLVLILSSVLFIAVLSACGGGGGGDAANVEPDREIVIKATNFTFEPNEIRVKKGEAIKLTIDNAQGNHGLAIKDYKVNIDSRNKSNVFVADKVGEFDMVCSIQCGPGHNDMVAKLIVEE